MLHRACWFSAVLAVCATGVCALPQATAKQRPASDSGFTELERSHWAFQPVSKPEPPQNDADHWSRNAVDQFVLRRLRTQGITPAPEADRWKLVRRLYYDLVGLPPTAEEAREFVFDNRPDAYERLVDDLLSRPEYGERWAQHWLDLVRYAESDGYRKDAYRPHAWRYRDYVITSFNDDKPYDRFVQEQIAGDELWPDEAQARCATGYLRLGIYEYNQSDVRDQWNAMLNEMTGVTGEVFLGMSIGCAECHDHKFDPIRQEDFYRLRAFFEATSLRDDVPFSSGEERRAYDKQLAVWKQETSAIREEMQAIVERDRAAARKYAISRFPKDIRKIVRANPETLGAGDKLLYQLARRQVLAESGGFRVRGDERGKWEELNKKLAAYDKLKPKPLPKLRSITDVGGTAPPTVIPGDRSGQAIGPGFPSILAPGPAEPNSTPRPDRTTGRRSVLARWLADPQNQLSMRVIVNRVWQHHFGAGLVATSSDFGTLGDPPSHPELMDWLVSDFVSHGMRLKRLHRILVTSSTYRQSVINPNYTLVADTDPENRLLWRANGRRLSAEEIRDTLMRVTGKLDLTKGGPSVGLKTTRRSIYMQNKRNKRPPILSTFDAPGCLISTSQRSPTTTSIQALYLVNGWWLNEQAEAVAVDVARLPEDQQIDALFLRVYTRRPTEEERRVARNYLAEHCSNRSNAEPVLQSVSLQLDATAPKRPAPDSALVDLAHILLVSNQFLYVE